MQPKGGSTHSASDASRDIVFACQHCSASFVVDSAAAGMTMNCQKCGEPTSVPTQAQAAAAAENAARVADLQRQLRENESQRVEITGHINQLNIQFHRLRLRLQTLKERQQKLQTELEEICRSRARTMEARPRLGDAAPPTLSATPSSG